MCWCQNSYVRDSTYEHHPKCPTLKKLTWFSLDIDDSEDENECPTCFGGGWECYGLGHNDPHFRECPTCYNPKDLPSP